jgi:hypothetical protein
MMRWNVLYTTIINVVIYDPFWSAAALLATNKGVKRIFWGTNGTKQTTLPTQDL